ncbi:MFS transporter [Tsukamurella sp. 8F]|uniref:MFS transporter n=1 Tax=unclassified Tsukamurella TaxID=2633480 RepID=UPI0023B9A3B7|nr:MULTISPECIES: MFS transporter [unclassified Tsukamurella]MDF0530623.1 MFS transporter [Tsukamurella sp. 8J]MDF0587824.1 MFS transporter [Tsukamurella sp. 8F]
MSTSETTAADGTSLPGAHPQRWAYGLLLVLLGLALGVSALPSPLYPIYQAEWGLTPLTTTVVFAVYAIGALGAALTVGPVSDAVGRKPVLIAAVLAITVGMAVFLGATTEWQLLIARFLHGAAIGSITVVAGAALLDVRPHDGPANGMRAGVALNVGIAVTVLGAAAAAQWAPAPLRTPFAAVELVVLAILAAVLVLVEPHTGRTGGRVRFRPPTVPRVISRDFWFSGIGILAAWSVLGVFLSLYPALAEHATGVDSAMFTGAVVATMAGSAALAQWIGGRYSPLPTAIVGDAGMIVSLALAVVAVHVGSAAFVIADAALLGVTFGLAFGGSLRHLTSVAPDDARGQVMSAFYLLGYLAMGIPTVIAGYLSTTFSTAAVFPWFAAAVGIGCLVAGLLGARSLTRTGADSASRPR